MKKEKNNVKNKSKKKYKMSKRTRIVLALAIFVIIILIVAILKYTNSEKYQKKKMEKLVISWAEEYYEDKLASIASLYIKSKANNNQNITINLDALKKFGKDTDVIKNSKNNRKCDDIDSYVSIKVEKDAKDIKKEYKVEKVVLDCFK